jgi:putative oxidoreductase
MLRKLFATRNDVALTIPRLVLGAVFFAHGAQKVFGWWGGHGFSATMGGFTQSGIPAPLAFLAIMAEFLGGLGLLLGLLGRVAAFGITCVMAVAIAKVHAANGLFMNWAGTQKGEGFEFHLLAIAIAVTVMVGGSGALSIDRLLTRPSVREPDVRHRRAA